jgi:hypothetical protein
VIVDLLSGAVPQPEAFALSEAVTLGRLRGYAEHFGGALEPARTHAEVTARWESARESAAGRAPTPDEFFAMLDESGIGLAGVYTESFGSRLGVPTAGNDVVAEFVATAPDRVLGFAGVDPWEADAPRVVEHAVGELGLHGVVVSPTIRACCGSSPGARRSACPSCCTPASTGRSTPPTTSGTPGTSTPSPPRSPTCASSRCTPAGPGSRTC